MTSLPAVASENQSEFQPEPKSGGTYGAHAFTSILKSYMCQTGPRAGYTRFSDAEKRAIINRHLEGDGLPPISRATYYRWKRQAIDAGLVEFQSGAKRSRIRRRAARGRWMSITTVPARVDWRTGRPPKKRETFDPPSTGKRETFGAHKRSPEKEQRSKPSRSERPRQERERTRPKPSFAPEVIEAEKQLTRIAESVSSTVKVPWEPLPEKETWRLGTIARWNDGCPTWYSAATIITVGMALSRAADIERARQSRQYHDFWETAEGDVVARALTHDRGESLYRRGAKWLWNTYGIDCQEEGFTGVEPPPLSKQEQVYAEAMVGAR